MKQASENTWHSTEHSVHSILTSSPFAHCECIVDAPSRGRTHPIYRHYHLASLGSPHLGRRQQQCLHSLRCSLLLTVSLDTHLALVALHGGIIISVLVNFAFSASLLAFAKPSILAVEMRLMWSVQTLWKETFSLARTVLADSSQNLSSGSSFSFFTSLSLSVAQSCISFHGDSSFLCSQEGTAQPLSGSLGR